jgi:hypothetical protein
MFAFMLEGVRDRKVQGRKIGFDGEQYPSGLAELSDVLYQELDLAGGLTNHGVGPERARGP